MPKKTGLNATNESSAKKETDSKKAIKNKENVPGPGSYQTVNSWKGK